MRLAVLLLVRHCTSCFHTVPKGFAPNPTILRDAEELHAAELASCTAEAFVGPVVGSRPAGVTITTHHVGSRFAGPDADALGDAAAYVHCSDQPVLTPAECMALRAEASAAMAMGCLLYTSPSPRDS